MKAQTPEPLIDVGGPPPPSAPAVASAPPPSTLGAPAPPQAASAPSSGALVGASGSSSGPATAASAVGTVLEGHSKSVVACSWSPGSDTLASGSEDGTVRVWAVRQSGSGFAASCAVLDPTASSGEAALCVTALDWSPSGDRLATGYKNGALRVWAMPEGRLLHSPKTHNATIMCVRWSPGGHRILTGSLDSTSALVNPLDGSLVRTNRSHTGGVLSCAWQGDARYATASVDRTVHLFSAEGEGATAVLKVHTGEVNIVACQLGPEPLGASGADDGNVVVWSASGAVMHTLSGHEEAVHAVQWAPRVCAIPDLLASASADTSVRLWNGRSGFLLHVLRGHSTLVQAVAFTPTGSSVVSGSSDRLLCFWSTKDGSLHHQYATTDPVVDVAVDKEGKWTAAVSGSTVVIVNSRF